MEPVAVGAMRFGGKRLLDLQSDEQLARLAAAGWDEAFEVLVRRYRAPLLRASQRVLSDGQAEDAVQQTFFNAHRALTANGAPGRVRPWLYRIAINASLKLQQQAATVPLEALDMAAASDSADEVYERHETVESALRTISALPERQRRALLLRELEGRTHEEIATELGLTGGAIRQLIYRARDTVRAAATALTPSPLIARLLGGEGADAARGVAEAAVVTGGGLAAKAAVATVVAGSVAGGLALSPIESKGGQSVQPAIAAEAAEVPVSRPLHGPVGPVDGAVAGVSSAGKQQPRRADGRSGPKSKRGEGPGPGGDGASGRQDGGGPPGPPTAGASAVASTPSESGGDSAAARSAGDKGGRSPHDDGHDDVVVDGDSGIKPDDDWQDEDDWESDDDEGGDDSGDGWSAHGDHGDGGDWQGGGDGGGSEHGD